MANLFEKLFKKQEPTKQQKVQDIVNDKEALSQLLGVYGLELTDDKQHVRVGNADKISYSPISFRHLYGSDDDGFLNWWSSAGYVDTKADEAARLKRYQDYRFMKENSPEVGLTIETYVDETLASTPTNDKFVTLEVYKEGRLDSTMTKLVNDELQKSGILGQSEVILENMVTYGDHFITIKNISENKDEIVLFSYIATDPAQFKRINFPDTDVPNKFYYAPVGRKQHDLYPWECVHFRILTSDRAFMPYGKSQIEKMRSAYKQLLINESILALSRASKVERLVVYVPMGGSNPETTFAKLMNSRANMKNAIFGTNENLKSRSRPPALSEVLFLPSSSKGEGEYRMDRLGSTIDISNTEDVNYFLDKLFVASRIPSSYFRATQESGQYIGFRKLQLLDLKFARAVVKVQKSFSLGCVNFGMIVLAYNKLWDETVEVKAKYVPAMVLDDQNTTSMSNTIMLVNNFLQGIMQTTGVQKLPPELIVMSLKSLATNLPEKLVGALLGLLQGAVDAQNQDMAQAGLTPVGAPDMLAQTNPDEYAAQLTGEPSNAEQPEGEVAAGGESTKKTRLVDLRVLTETLSRMAPVPYEYVSSKDIPQFPISLERHKILNEAFKEHK